jgi:hypothetical protein
MRNLFAILFAILMFGCVSSDSHPIAPGTGDQYAPVPNLKVLLKVSGDPSTGPPTFAVALDCCLLGNLAPDVERQFAVSTGNHTITLGVSYALFFTPSWCYALGPSSFPVQIRNDSMTRVTLSVSCPPLTGNGVLRLSLSASGSSQPTEVPVTMIRLNGETISSSVVVPANSAVDVTLPTGLYRAAPRLPSNCRVPYVLFGSAVPYRAVREGSTTTLEIRYSCS